MCVREREREREKEKEREEKRGAPCQTVDFLLSSAWSYIMDPPFSLDRMTRVIYQTGPCQRALREGPSSSPQRGEEPLRPPRRISEEASGVGRGSRGRGEESREGRVGGETGRWEEVTEGSGGGEWLQ